MDLRARAPQADERDAGYPAFGIAGPQREDFAGEFLLIPGKQAVKIGRFEIQGKHGADDIRRTIHFEDSARFFNQNRKLAFHQQHSPRRRTPPWGLCMASG